MVKNGVNLITNSNTICSLIRKNEASKGNESEDNSVNAYVIREAKIEIKQIEVLF